MRKFLSSPFLLPVLALVVIGASLYAVNLTGPLFWDDEAWIIHNPFVHNLSWESFKNLFSENVLAGIGFNSNYYRPLLFVTFAVNYAISGVEPISYHAVSNFLHIFNAVLVFFLLLPIVRSRFAAWIASLLFLIHPIATEAVTYISGRGDPLHLFFMLAALLVWRNRSHKSHWSYLLLIFALLSHEKAIVFPFLAFMYDVVQTKSIRTTLKRTVPFFIIVAAYGVLRLTVLNFNNTLNFFEMPNPYSESLMLRMFTFFHALLIYFGILFVPVGLHMERSVPLHSSFFEWPVWAAAVLLAGILYWSYRSYKTNRTYSWVLIFGVAWFFIALGPVSGITPINAQIYEHWLYIPIVGIAALAGYGVARLREKFGVWVLVGLLAYGAFFALQTVRRNMLWGKPIAFYEDILRYEPDSVRINNNLANHYFNAGDTAQAKLYYQKAVAEEDIFPQPHYNL